MWHAGEGRKTMSVAIADEFLTHEKKAVIKVCGIGGGGSNAVTRMIEAGLKDVEFITINTDAQALRSSPAGVRLQIGQSGLGAGARPEVGEQAALEDRDRIADVLKGADMIFLTAGLGGGTGTGAIPVVAEVAQQTGALTVAIVTLPFAFEGGERMKNAMKGLAGLQDHVDAAIVVPNDRLSVFCQSNLSLLTAFRLADEVLHNGVRAISELITVTGLINLDFADVRTIMEKSGRALMGIGVAEGEQRAIRAAEDAIVCPLLENSTIEGATRVIVNIQGGSDIGMREVHDAVSTVQKAAHPNANIIFGAVVDDCERPELKVTVIAAGFADARVHTVVPFTQTADISNETTYRTIPDEKEKTIQEEAAAPADLEKEPAAVREPVSVSQAPSPRGGENAPVQQVMFPEETTEEDQPYETTTHGKPLKDSEDLSIPTFLRRRMKRS